MLENIYAIQHDEGRVLPALGISHAFLPRIMACRVPPQTKRLI